MHRQIQTTVNKTAVGSTTHNQTNTNRVQKERVMIIRSLVGKQIINTMIIAFVALAIVVSAASSARAENIVWVTDTRDGVVQADWRTILTNAGYTVTGFIGALNPTDPGELATLNAADLVIYDNSHGSTEGNGATWNALTAPLLSMSNYIIDNWAWTANNVNGSYLRPKVYVTSDPMWTGVTVPLTNNLFTSNRGVSGALKSGGIRIAGDDADGRAVIARWAAGALVASGGARMHFCGHASGGNNAMNLTALGQTVWLNAIDSLINPATAPLLLVTEPVDNDVNLSTSIDLSASFDRLMQAGTGSISLYKSDATPVESFVVETSGQLTFNLATVTIDPTNNLEVGTEYYVLIDATAIESAADGSPFVGISDPTAWSFTTDGTPPDGAPLWPADANALPNTDLEITFDENVVAGSGNITIHLTSDDSVVDTIAVSTAAISGSEVILTLNEALAYGTAYYVNAPSGAFRDPSGNDWVGISDSTTWNFSTVDEDATLIMWVIAAHDGSVPSDWNTFLATAGYVAVGFRGGITPTVAERDTLNSADVIIFDGSNGSSQSGTASVWNGLTAPLISMGAYSTDNWGWMTGSGAAGGSTGTPTVDDAGDAAWSGVTVPLTEPLFTSVRLATPIQTGKGGTTVASVGTDVAIARWPAESFAAGGGERIFFAGASGSSSYNLTSLGRTVFLNAIDSLLPQPPAGTVISIQ